MPRRHSPEPRPVLPDAKYKNVLVSKFINVVMRRGKKSVAERIVYRAMEEIEKKHKQDPVEVFTKAVENVKPQMEVKTRRVGG
ncbi:MAG: 30S ribosomal protein S7, partial [Betaproteobacteria bacterium]|nr:30S ribosomal protein S7 [Betaproteobacteria bacterium]